MGMSGVEEAAGAEGVVASHRPVAVTGADGDGEIGAAFSIVGAGPIATASRVVIDGGPEAMGVTGEGGGARSARVPVGPAGGLSGAPWSQPQGTSSVCNCDIQEFLLMILNGSALPGIRWYRRLGA